MGGWERIGYALYVQCLRQNFISELQLRFEGILLVRWLV